MDEKRRAEEFNRGLDALLAGKSSGSELPEAARRLGEADFSKESRIRESLRRRLLGRRASSEGLLGWLTPAPVRLAAAAALLVLVMVFPLRQVLRRVPPETPTPVGPYAPGAAGSGTVPAAQPVVPQVPVRPEVPVPVQPPSQAVQPAMPAPAEAKGLDESEIWNKPVTAEDLIERVPADRVFERRSAKGLLGSVAGSPLRPVRSKGPLVKVSASPRSPIPAQPVFSNVRARKVAGKDRMQIVWETEDSTFILEQRTTSLEELFQRGAL